MVVQNVNGAGDAAYGVFDSNGTLIGSGSPKIRIGYFNLSDQQVSELASQNDFSSLDGAFVQFGDAFDFNIAGGAFQQSVQSISDSFVNQKISLWVAVSGDFSSSSSEHFIYQFTTTFRPEPWIGGQVLLGTTSGQILVGEFGNYSHDFSQGGGSLEGFNTVLNGDGGSGGGNGNGGGSGGGTTFSLDGLLSGADSGGGARFSNWFGFYFPISDTERWNFHNDLGWIYPIGDDGTSMWYWDIETSDFWWTGEGTFPFTFRSGDGTWYFFLERTEDGSRWFSNQSTGNPEVLGNILQ